MTVLAALAAGVAIALVVPGAPWRRLVARRRSGPDRTIDPLLAVTLLVPVACTLVLGLQGLVVAVALVPAARVAVARLESAADRARRDRLLRQLPLALDLVVAVLDVGRGPADALQVVAAVSDEPLATELSGVVARLRIGHDPLDVWRRMSQDAVLGPVGRAFGRAASSGMPVARVVEQLASEQRREAVARRRETARRVGVQTAAPLGLCFLPAFFSIGIGPTVIGLFSRLDLVP